MNVVIIADLVFYLGGVGKVVKKLLHMCKSYFYSTAYVSYIVYLWRPFCIGKGSPPASPGCQTWTRAKVAPHGGQNSWPSKQLLGKVLIGKGWWANSGRRCFLGNRFLITSRKPAAGAIAV